jgi:hypothetical protein
VAAGFIVFNAYTRPSYALSTWSQTTWNQGEGSSTANQYASANNVDTSTANQLSLAKGTNKFSNSTFDNDITGWNGQKNTYDTTQSYSATGANKITAGSVSIQSFNAAVVNTASTTLPMNVAAGDVNNDGRDDLITANYTNNSITVYLSSESGTISTGTTYATNTFNAKYVTLGDLNNDGYKDVVVTFNYSTAMSVLINNGSGGFGTPTRYTPISSGGNSQPCTATIGLFNNDSYNDIALVCYTHTELYVFYNNGDGTFPLTPTVTSASNVLTSGGSGQITSADINNDGHPDIMSAPGTITGCSFSYFLNDGNGGFTEHTYTLTTSCNSNIYIYGMGMNDFNKDGYIDVVLATSSPTPGYYYTILSGSASGLSAESSTKITGISLTNGQTSIATGDFTGDSYPDFAINAPQASLIRVFSSNGNGTFTAQADMTAVNYYTIVSYDADGDGKLDLAASTYSANTIPTFLNRAQGDTLTQAVNTGNTDSYQMEAYVYTDGSAVTGSDVTLFANGYPVSTTYTADGSNGWYKLTGKTTGSASLRGYGVLAKQGKTIYVDNLNLYSYPNGSLTSAIFDPGFGGDWGVLSYSTTISSAVQVKVRTSNNADMSGSISFEGCSAIASGNDISSNGCVTDNNRYIQYQILLSPSSGETPIFTSFSLTYAPYDTNAPPTNASNISMLKAAGGASVSSNGWTNGASPYFSWTAGADGEGESGVAGYCLYLGTDATQTPKTSKGLLGTSPVTSDYCPFVVAGTSVNLATAGYIGTALTTSDAPYYLNVKVLDVAGNVYSGTSAQFQFRFDNTPPTNPAYLSAPSQYINTKNATLTWPTGGSEAAKDDNSGVAGLQYQIGSTGWYGDSHSGTGAADDLLADDGSYTTTAPDDPDDSHLIDGVNLIYLRTWDEAGNISVSPVSAALKINTSSAPTAPTGVGAAPTTNTSNAFAFHWSQPATFSGAADNLVYCYTINTLPTSSNCTYTAAGVTSLDADAFATQPGENTFYVVAKDEAGNINYSNFASTTFYANTPAPGLPTNVDAADVSVKVTANWRLAITWDAPADTGAGIASYKIYRSTNNTGFNQVGSSSSTSFVDVGLSQQTYYYYVKACDSANQCSAVSSTVSKKPTGKFTSPASQTSSPVISNITTKRATITWTTDRASDSKISLGTKSGSYSPSEVGNSNQVSAHQIDLDNLAAGTTYYFKAKWTDEDGNTGSSQEYTFVTVQAPVLKEVNTLAVGLSNATIQFTSKEAVKVSVNFGKSDSFGGVKSINTSSRESTYEIDLSGLDDGTKYFYRLTLYDSEGGAYGSSIFSFSTPPRPKILNLRFQPVEGEPTSTQQVSWDTNVPTNTTLNYGKVDHPAITVETQESKTSHVLTIRGLEDESQYYLIAQGRDDNGNLATSDRQVFKTALDTRPPKITDTLIEPTIRGTGAEARGQIVVSWHTDEPSTSQVAYAEGSDAKTFNNRTAEDGQLTTEHLVIVSDLPTSKVYSIAPVSKDKAGNRTTAETQAAIIGRASDSVLNIVLSTLQKVFGF